MRTIALYATETMADWEYAYLTTQITVLERLRPGRFQLLLVGDGTQPVTSLGGLPLTPAHDLDVLTPLAQEGSLAALVIPGGDTYTSAASAERGPHGRLVEAVRAVVDHGVPVAAICGAPARTGARAGGRRLGEALPDRTGPALHRAPGGGRCLAELLKVRP